MAHIPYILIAVYFLGLVLLCIFVLARPDSSLSTQEKRQQKARSKVSLTKNMPAYGLLAALFAFFLVLTVVLNHDTSQTRR